MTAREVKDLYDSAFIARNKACELMDYLDNVPGISYDDIMHVAMELSRRADEIQKAVSPYLSEDFRAE